MVRLLSLSPHAMPVDTKPFTPSKSMVPTVPSSGTYMTFTVSITSSTIKKMPKPVVGVPFMLPTMVSIHIWINGGFLVLTSDTSTASSISSLIRGWLWVRKNARFVPTSATHWKHSISAKLFWIPLSPVAGKKW